MPPRFLFFQLKRQRTIAENRAEEAKSLFLATHGLDQKRRRETRSCNKKQETGRVRPTVQDYRGLSTFALDSVKIGASDIEGRGLMATRGVVDGAVIFEVELPDVGEEQGYSSGVYDDNVHVAHKDGQSAALIDAGSTMEGNLLACYEDVKASYIRSMNHKKKTVAKGKPGANVRLDFTSASVPDWYFPAGGVVYDVWHRCSVVATRDIKPGEELTFEYAWTPKTWG